MKPYYSEPGIEIYLGDCLEIMPELEPVETIITDPPYGMDFVSNHRIEKYPQIANDQDPNLFRWACGIPVKNSRYVFCRWDNIKDAPSPKSCITWVKNNWSMGDLKHEHARQTECILFWPGDSHAFPNERPTDVIFADRTGNNLHPTEKPVQLIKKIIEWTTGTILDPFMGSGTTLLAAKELGRKAIGIEIEEKYVDIAIKRLRQEVFDFKGAK